MTKLSMKLPALVVGACMGAANAANAECGEVSMTEMNWASAQIIAEISTFLLEQGYGCTVEKVPSSTTTSVASLAENGEPDIVIELWLNSAGEVYDKLEAEGKVERLVDVIQPGGVEGWWVPAYLAEQHPELATIEGVMANIDVVGGRFNNCPDGWGCRIVNDNLIEALDMRDRIEIFDHGSGETLAASIASAFENEEPWFGYYWGPTAVLGKYQMAKVEIGELDEEIHTANQNADNPDPGVSDFLPAPVLNVATRELADREPDVAEVMGNVAFDVDVLSGLLAWQEDNGASAEEAAAHFLSTRSDLWAEWISDDARDKLAHLIK